MTYFALLVEDNEVNGSQYSEILRSKGFEVTWFTNAAETMLFLQNNPHLLIDLFVLDRAIFDVPGGEVSIEAGDNLFETVQAQWTDTPIIVFTGHKTPDHALHAISNRGRLELAAERLVDRVQVMYKEEGSRFVAGIDVVAAALDELQDIHVVLPTELGTDDNARALRRLIAKIAMLTRCHTVRTRMLGGGRSGDKVFECEVVDDNGIVAAAYIAKSRNPDWEPRHTGMYALPQEIVAPRVQIVSGLASGLRLELFPIVDGATPLDELTKNGDEQAPASVGALRVALQRGANSATLTVTLERLLSPLVTMDFFSESLSKLGLTAPRSTVSIQSTHRVQHGDLHGGNVLVKDSRPTLIDFGRLGAASHILDPITLLLSMWLHPDGIWFSSAASIEPSEALAAIEARDVSAIPNDTARSIAEWVIELDPLDRELWAVATGYAIRQLRYETRDSELAVSRVRAIAIVGCTRIQE